MQRKSIIHTLITSWLLLASPAVFSVTSTEVTPPEIIPMVMCPNMIVNGMTLTVASQNIPLGDVTDCIDVDGGATGWAGVWLLGIPVGGWATNFDAVCPPDHPYLGSVKETWGGVMPVGGGGTFNATCCAMPVPQVSQTGVWVQGPDCP